MYVQRMAARKGVLDMRTTKWLVATALIITAAATAASLAYSPAFADVHGGDRWAAGQGFSNRSIKGFWGYSTSYSALLPPLLPEPASGTALGRVYFDGEGGCSVRFWGNVNGQTNTAQSSSCSYTVNADGTGSSEASFPGTPFAGPIRLVFIIVDDGRELRMMNTESIVSTATARRQ
jgi:hypothetical protein